MKRRLSLNWCTRLVEGREGNGYKVQHWREAFSLGKLNNLMLNERFSLSQICHRVVVMRSHSLSLSLTHTHTLIMKLSSWEIMIMRRDAKTIKSQRIASSAAAALLCAQLLVKQVEPKSPAQTSLPRCLPANSVDFQRSSRTQRVGRTCTRTRNSRRRRRCCSCKLDFDSPTHTKTLRNGRVSSVCICVYSLFSPALQSDREVVRSYVRSFVLFCMFGSEITVTVPSSSSQVHSSIHSRISTWVKSVTQEVISKYIEIGAKLTAISN